MPIDSEISATPGFEPHIFWEAHKGKIIFYSALLIGALLIFSIYEYTTSERVKASGALFAQAKTADDYKAVIEKYPHTISAGNASLLLAQTLRDEKKYDDAVATLRKFTQDFPDHPLLSTGWLSLAETLEAQGKTDEAASTFQQVTSKFPDSYSAPIAALEQANLLRLRGKNDEARVAYENILTQYRDSYCAQEATRDLRLLHK